MTPDLAQAREFLHALTGSPESPVTWQSYTDRKPEPRSPKWRDSLARILHGSLAELAPALRSLNGEGAGIFAAVNETDLRGRHASNVIALRAGFADDDVGTLVPAVPFSFATRTARGVNPFWRLSPGQPVHRFRELQTRIADYYGSDRAVKDPSRVMRVPGFLHLKAEPRMVEFVPGDGCLWTIDELLDAHPIRVVPSGLPPAAFRDERHPSVCGRGREAALYEIVRSKASARNWTVGNRHASAVSTISHGRKLGLSRDAVVAAAVEFLVAAGKSAEEADEIADWAWATLEPDPDEIAGPGPVGTAERKLRQGLAPALVCSCLQRWFGLPLHEADRIVATVRGHAS
ncbi:MAG: hypothetical protein EDX89_24010 [Acidobacteria bacterium]|nr:MAG: hypothetical protein EDX89_24010 [Acidobacteriota bacterium]MCE7957219.1 hypothetical protein [Acidobacteria bacterium ACB2]